jgi:hypothetical protein
MQRCRLASYHGPAAQLIVDVATTLHLLPADLCANVLKAERELIERFGTKPAPSVHLPVE